MRICSKCDQANTDWATFCGRCGVNLAFNSKHFGDDATSSAQPSIDDEAKQIRLETALQIYHQYAPSELAEESELVEMFECMFQRIDAELAEYDRERSKTGDTAPDTSRRGGDAD